MPRTEHSSSRQSLFDAASLRIGLMVLLFSAAAVFETIELTSLSTLSNSDNWWHLRTGIWIIQNHSVPRTGIFSQTAQLAWVAPSWAYDLLAAVAFRIVGLRSFPVMLMIFKTALAVMTFLLAGGLRGRFWLAVVLSAISQFILSGIQPGPTYCSTLLFAGELLLLSETRRTGDVRHLFYWLPPLFFLWANLDIQFVYGVLALLLWVIATLLHDMEWTSETFVRQRLAVSAARFWMLPVPCGFATVCTPYAYRMYGVFLTSVSSAANRYFPDFQAMTFHRPQDYLLLLLTMGAFLSLGRHRSRDPFQIALMVGCAMLSFHEQRSSWLATIASVAVIAHTTPVQAEGASRRGLRVQALATSGLVLATLIVAAWRIPHSQTTLLAKVGGNYPVRACDYVREHQLPQPLFNAYPWGGFLTWYLPEYPVAIDGRTGLYGDDVVTQYSKVMNADMPYTNYPPLNEARTLLLQRNSLMAEALSTLPQFKVAYSDDVAVVLLATQ